MTQRMKRDNDRSSVLYMTALRLPDGEAIGWRRLAPIVRAVRRRGVKVVRLVINNLTLLFDGHASDGMWKALAVQRICSKCRFTNGGRLRACSAHRVPQC